MGWINLNAKAQTHEKAHERGGELLGCPGTNESRVMMTPKNQTTG
jgi:hypothetical protein